MQTFRKFLLLLGALAVVPLAHAWDYEGHRAINQLAIQSLPTNFPSFVRVPAAAERISFLAGEPDRWRNTPDLPFKHFNGPDHYIDVEELAVYGMKAEMLPVFRYDFVAQLALFRQAHPDKFHIDTSKNEDHTRELIGLLPWGITEAYGKVKSGFSYLKTFEENGGTPDEIENAKANIVYAMGIMGHLVGDAGQPLHTTIHHHGWVGENPKGYSTNNRIHSWIDGGYFAKSGGATTKDLLKQLRPAQLVSLGSRPAKPEEMFQATMLFLIEQNKLVEPLYQMDKDGRLSPDAPNGGEGKIFLEKQLLKSAQLLGDFWFSAWQQAPPDTFLRTQLTKRKKVAAE